MVPQPLSEDFSPRKWNLSQDLTWRRRFFNQQRNCYSFILAPLLLDAMLTSEEEFLRAGNEVPVQCNQWVWWSRGTECRAAGETLLCVPRPKTVVAGGRLPKQVRRDCSRGLRDPEHRLTGDTICFKPSWFFVGERCLHHRWRHWRWHMPWISPGKKCSKTSFSLDSGDGANAHCMKQSQSQKWT